uniref:uncharacterized protein LOC122597361 n=1 Tax=Erigeron canadensis TaxID=72917 RepID=UPI001CB9B25C|nr:uncharacterized protein LOC122597361 [Erigeron canadensis]
MDNKITTATIFNFFTLLIITVSAARPTINTPVTKPSTIREPETFTGSHILLPGHNVTSQSNATTSTFPVNSHHVQPENTTSDMTPRMNFTKFHSINRHYNEKPHRRPYQVGRPKRPCRKHSQYQVDRTKIPSRNNERIGKYEDTRSKSIHAEVPTNWLKMKHYHASLAHRNHNNQQKGSENVIKTKHVFDREKLKNLIREKDRKRREEENGLMKNIRKFMKHTFD